MLYRAMDGAMICWGIVELNISALTTKMQLTQSVIPTVNGSRDKVLYESSWAGGFSQGNTAHNSFASSKNWLFWTVLRGVLKATPQVTYYWRVIKFWKLSNIVQNIDTNRKLYIFQNVPIEGSLSSIQPIVDEGGLPYLEVQIIPASCDSAWKLMLVLYSMYEYITPYITPTATRNPDCDKVDDWRTNMMELAM